MIFINKNFKYLIFILIFTSYISYSQLISWGSDYAGYILQGKAMLLLESNLFIKKQIFLHGLSLNPKYPIYAPVGMPLLLGGVSTLTNNIYFLKALIPISMFIICLIVRKNIHNYLIPLILCIHPSILDQYRDIGTEIPATMFLLLGFFSKNQYLRILYLLISCLIRPTFIIFVVIEYVLNKNKKINEFILFLFTMCLVQLLSKLVFSMNIYGFYINANSKNSNYGVFEIMLNNLQNLNFDRVQFFLREIGLMLIGFSNILNMLIGLVFLLLMLFLKNRYSIMIFAFSVFHLAWNAQYFARYLIPTIIISIFAINEFYNFNNSNNEDSIKKLTILFLIVFLPQIFYGYSILDKQSGPHNVEAQEMFNFIDSYDKNYLYSFNQPRTFRLLTKRDAYKLDGKIYENTVIICNKKQDACKLNLEYHVVFENSLYQISDKISKDKD